jgi:hypothetical protein
LVTVVEEHVDEQKPRYNFAAFMDTLEAENGQAREEEEQKSEKPKAKKKANKQVKQVQIAKLKRGRATKVIEIAEEDSDASRTDTVQVSSDSKRLGGLRGRQHPDVDVEREVPREEEAPSKKKITFGAFMDNMKSDQTAGPP